LPARAWTNGGIRCANIPAFGLHFFGYLLGIHHAHQGT
jgi:hypothetical protein